MSPRTLCFTTLALLALATAPAARAMNVDDVRKDFAHAVYEGAPQWVHDRRPQPLLRAVIVLNVKLGPDNHWEPQVLRTNNEQPEMLARALETVRRARAPHVPEHLRSELSRNGFIETWLFDRDGSFQVKTLAKPQRGL